MLFFTAAMCRRAINIRWTKPCPGPFGGCTRSHPGLSPVRLHAQPFCLCGWQGRGAERQRTSQCAAGLQDYIKLGSRTYWNWPRLPASWQRPSAQLCGVMETAGGAEGTATDGPTRRAGADSGHAGFWRPWVDGGGEKEEDTPNHAAEAMPDGPGMTAASGKLSQFRHPVRLFWPKSKCYDYLYQEAEALLKNFPIQATISFYEDSDSEDEIEELTCEN
ncbi:protein ripply2 [Nomascus leucogenys]|nr:protein ripply2 [Nomascus leucogenys]